MSTVFSAGFGCVDVTPPADTHLCGFAARVERAAGIHDPLYARALVVADAGGGDRSALVACDVVGLDIDQTDRVRHQVEHATGIPAHAVVVTATHTHGGPPTMPDRLGGRVDAGYVERLLTGAVDAVRRADAARVPARLRLGAGREPTVAHNRRIPGGLIDPRVSVLRVDDVDGHLLGLVCQYACHPVTLGADNRQVTADYPGYVVRALEELRPGATALFVTGCAGQLNTGHSTTDSVSRHGTPRRTFAEARRIGHALADAAIQAAEHSVEPDDRSSTSSGPDPHPTVGAVVRTVELPLLPVESPARLREQAERWRAESRRAEVGQARLLDCWVDWARHVATDDHPATSVRATVTVLRWGGITLVCLPGEPFVELGLDIRQRAACPVVVLGYANGVPGYIPHRSAYAEGGYEPCEAHRFYRQPSAFAPEAGELLVEQACDAIRACRS